jgi:hypothetical protein
MVVMAKARATPSKARTLNPALSSARAAAPPCRPVAPTTATTSSTVVIVDPTGVLRWIDVYPNYTTRTEVGDILAALDTVS